MNIAVFGGSFNPPTIAHIEIIRKIADIDYIDKVIVIPVGDFYNKKDLAPANHRLNMLKHIEDDNITVSDIEIKASYQYKTYETLAKLQELYPDDTLSFVVGADNLEEINTWVKAEELLKNFKIFVLERKGYSVDNIIKNCSLLKKYRKNIQSEYLNLGTGVSSTEVRNNIFNNKPIDKLVDYETEQYIYNHHIYK